MGQPLVIDFDPHALYRLYERGSQFGLDPYEAQRRAQETILSGQFASRKHLSKIHRTYYRYFSDNLSFYVVCKEIDLDEPTTHLVKTIIIERGRQ